MAGEINLDAGIFTIRAGAGLIIVLLVICLLMLASMNNAERTQYAVNKLERDTVNINCIT